MGTLFDPSARASVRARLARLTPEHEPWWGSMHARQMLVHIADQLRMSLGDLPVRSVVTPLRRWPFKQLVVYVLPWPKGARTAPELLAGTPTEWARDRAAVEQLIERVATLGPKGPFALHPAFGALSGRAWGVLAYRHLDHHLRQFGV